MKGDVIPDDDHVGRLCSASNLDEDGTVSWPAFALRLGETYLSVNWLEIACAGTRTEQVVQVLRVLATKRKIGAKDRLAVFNVGMARFAVFGATRCGVRFLHAPTIGTPLDPTHSGIYDLPADKRSVEAARALATAVAALVPARLRN
jgi:hypothetical protein